jgi:two-component system, LytTR family, response regulator
MTSSSSLRCLIADDDPLICETVESHLQKAGGLDYCIKANDGLTALNLLSAGGFNLVFLDLHMPGLDGESLLRAMPRNLPVIVISASKDFAAQSYEFDVVDYLVKPLEFPRFCQALHKARQRIAANAGGSGDRPVEEIFVKDGTRVQKVDLQKLLLIKAEANYVDFIMEEQSVMSLMSLKRLEDLLPEHFIRVHRSYMVNRNRISRIEDGQVIIGKHRVPVGDSYREEFLRRLKVAN